MVSEISPDATGRPSGSSHIVGLAVPVMLANLAQPLMSAVDTAIAGHLTDKAALGGVAIGGLFFNFVFWCFGFLRMATTGFVAQAIGAGDAQEERAIRLRAFVLAIGIGLAILLLEQPLIALALRLIGGSAAVQGNAASYAAARIWSAPATLGGYVVLGVFLGRQRPSIALILQLIANGANAALAFVIVDGLGRHVAGLGAATAIADWLTFAVGLLLLHRERSGDLPAVSWRTVLDRAALSRLFAVNRDIFVRTLCLIGGFGWFAHCGAALGDTVLAANALLLNFQLFMASALDGFAQAAEMIVGTAIGAGDRRAFWAAVANAGRAGLLVAVAIAIVYALAGPFVIDFLTDQLPVRALAREMLTWICLSPLVSLWCFLLDGIFIGATRGRELRNGMLLALGGLVASTWLLQPRLGDEGLWLAFLLFMAFRGAALAWWLPRLGMGGWSMLQPTLSWRR